MPFSTKPTAMREKSREPNDRLSMVGVALPSSGYGSSRPLDLKSERMLLYRLSRPFEERNPYPFSRGFALCTHGSNPYHVRC
jgi:hypothetical protein